MSVTAIFNIAQSALFTHSRSLDVVAHNIANVNTPGFSRQNALLVTNDPVTSGGLMLGQGVNADQVLRSTNEFVEQQLLSQNADLASFEEMEKFARVLESIFSENQDTSLSTRLSDFWNLWQDVANNPAGLSERRALCENTVMLCDQFNALRSDLSQLRRDITNALSSGVDHVNALTQEIAELNAQIVRIEASEPANDLRDQRDQKLNALGEYLDIKTFEQENGAVDVITVKGCILVQRNAYYELRTGGLSGEKVEWLGSDGAGVDLSAHIDTGRIGGWLEMRDEKIKQYQLELDELSRALIWSVNAQHSQGVGSDLFAPGTVLSGDYKTSGDLSDLAFGDQIQFTGNAFKLWIEDRSDPANPVISAVDIDLSGLNSGSGLSDLAAAVNTQIAAAGLSGVSADGSGAVLTLTADGSHAFGFSDDTSGMLATLGLNTFFSGSDADTITLNPLLENEALVAAGLIDSATGAYYDGDNTNALAMAELQHQSLSIPRWACNRRTGDTSMTTSTTIETYYHTLVGSMGTHSAGITRNRQFKEAMCTQIGALRDGISAVSLDEEMADMIQFQHAYTAAGKLITTADEMLETVLGLK